MNLDTLRPNDSAREALYRGRLFLREPGWRIDLKVGSHREFCYAIAPGQDHYHRLYDGEIVISRGEERLCLACAERRGLLAHAPRPLREPAILTDPHGRPLVDDDYDLSPCDHDDELDNDRRWSAR
jgi:hypothetical protein